MTSVDAGSTYDEKSVQTDLLNMIIDDAKDYDRTKQNRSILFDSRYPHHSSPVEVLLYEITPSSPPKA